MNLLFIGRFQPFHHGHLKILSSVHTDEIFLSIGIGSSQYHHSLQNPFSYEERKEMIQDTLNDQDITAYQIYPIPDIHDPPHWVDHVKTIITDFDVIVANSQTTIKLFREHGYQIKQTPSFDRSKLSGRHIRACIIEGKPWKDLVPKPVYTYIKAIDGENRIQSIAKND